MERYIRFFQEGKQQAIQLLKKLSKEYIYDEFLQDDQKIEWVVKKLERYDPTYPKNKYLELLTRTFIEDLKKGALPYLDDISANFAIYRANLSDRIVPKLIYIEKRKLPFNTNFKGTGQELSEVLNELTSVITTSKLKQGVKGLTPNKDYFEIPLPDENVKAYIPLNYKASVVLASKYTGDCEGAWCTAYQKSDDYWLEYVHTNDGILVYVIDNNWDIDSRFHKIAMFYTKDEDSFDIKVWDSKDKEIAPSVNRTTEEIDNYVYYKWDKIKRYLEINKQEYINEGEV